VARIIAACASVTHEGGSLRAAGDYKDLHGTLRVRKSCLFREPL